MTTLFIVEKNKVLSPGAASALMGDYAVRAFASLYALKHLGKVPGQAIPDIIVVDVDDVGLPIPDIVAKIAEILPNSGVILLQAWGTTESQSFLDRALPERVYCFRKPLDSLGLSQFVAGVARTLGKRSSQLRLGDFIFDFERLSCRVLQDEKSISLPLKEAQILKLMMERAGECLSRDDINKLLWPGVKISPRTIDSHISRLRQRLRSTPVSIGSKYGDGYLLRLVRE